MKRNPWACYREVAAQTASPGQLVLMLYEGAISFLERALHGFSLEDPAELNQTVGNNVLRAQAVLEELDRSLNLAAGGDFAIRLRGLYHYFDRRLMEGNLRKEPDGIREVLARLVVIRDAWCEMLQQQAAPQAAGSASLTHCAV